MAKRVSSRSASKKCEGGLTFFNLLTRISLQPARASSGVGRAGPLTRKKKIGT